MRSGEQARLSRLVCGSSVDNLRKAREVGQKRLAFMFVCFHLGFEVLSFAFTQNSTYAL